VYDGFGAFSSLSRRRSAPAGYSRSWVVLLLLVAVGVGRPSLPLAASGPAAEIPSDTPAVAASRSTIAPVLRPIERPELEPSRPFSPFDATFRRYAGSQRDNDELIAIIAAATRRESGWDPSKVGDDGQSVGLFQINDVHGLTRAQRADPERAARFMVPRFVAAYEEVRAASPALAGPELASLVAGAAERPNGWTDPGSPARASYRESYSVVVGTR